MLSERRNTAAARRFFKRAIAANGQSDRTDIDKNGANFAGQQAVNLILKFKVDGQPITIRQKKYFSNILEQDHRFIKRITSPMLGFKASHSAAATIGGIEVAKMIRKGQFCAISFIAFQPFTWLAA